MSYATKWLRAGALFVLAFGLAGSVYAQRNVTLELNMATAPDTVNGEQTLQIRGCLTGCEGDQSDLPDGNVIAWNDNTTLTPTNVAGDYWTIDFQIPDDAELNFKVYSQQLEDDGVGGWEDGGNHQIAAGTGDVVMPLHYYEKGDDQAYDWTPFADKMDSVGVHFRVFMSVESAKASGVEYDRDRIGVDQQINVLGSFNGWGGGVGVTVLEPESGTEGNPGYHIFSGMHYFPSADVGTEQAFKFAPFTDPDGTPGSGDDLIGWESSPDRTFTIPVEDTTLHWAYYNNDPNVAEADPVTSNIIFTTNLDAFESIGLFSKADGDSLEVRGSFNGWNCEGTEDPNDCLASDVPGSNDFELFTPLTLFPDQTFEYKFFLNFNDGTFRTRWGLTAEEDPPSGWEEGHSTGINRQATFAGEPEQDLGIAFFNDVETRNIIPAGNTIELSMSVDMSSTDTIEPFDPAGGDSVLVQLEDPLWAFTQGLLADDSIDGGDRPDLIGFLTDDDNDLIYTGSIMVEGPTYGIITFKYGYGQRDAGLFSGILENGGDTSTEGRSRAHYIQPNSDGSWPASFALPAHSFQVDGALPFETNTVAVEPIDGVIPTTVTLGVNYPNPFTANTTFRYAVAEAGDVNLSIYNVLGQRVATVVDGRQPASEYEVSYDASGLASGTYFYRLEAGNQVITRTMVIVR